MRRTLALIATAGILGAVLAGCTSTSTGGVPPCTSPVESGAASKLVTVSGKLGVKPRVDFPTPLKSKTTQRSQIIAGSGDPVVAGQKVAVDLSIYNGTTGDVVQQSGYDGKSLTSFVLNQQTMTGLSQGLQCTQVGSRVALVVSPADAFGPKGGNAQLKIGANDALVLVLDIVKAYLPRANGADQPAVNGLPPVVLAANGTPGVTIPSGAPPAKLEIGLLKKGAGQKVKAGDTVTAQYTGLLWKEKTVFGTTWGKNSPVEFLAADGTKTQGGVIPGLAAAMLGQTVGSQVIAVIPPDQAYGDTVQGPVPAGSTLVFVLDILGVN